MDVHETFDPTFASNIRIKAQDSAIMEAFLEATPQLLLQSFIILKTGEKGIIFFALFCSLT